MRREEQSVVVIPVRMPTALYEALAALALRDERTRCSMIRRLIADETRRARRRAAREAARG